jgi:hypothetical protein
MERNMQQGKIAIGYFLAVLLLCSCSTGVSYVAKYGLAYNSEREKLGIPRIPSAWTIQDMGKYFDCFEPNPNQKIPHRLLKRVFIENGVIVRETDTFYSGRTFYYAPEQITLPEEISIEYNYLHSKDETPWTVHADLSASERSKSISIEEARQILTSWGLWK